MSSPTRGVLSGLRRFGTRGGSRALAAVLTMTALLVVSSATAEAHDVLVGTSPANGSVTAIVPAQVTLTFNEPVLAVGTFVLVTGPGGQVQTGGAGVVGRTVTQRLRAGSPAGPYTVAWRVSSADGHPTSGQYSFTASSPSRGAQATATATAEPPSTNPATAATTAVTSAATPVGGATTGGTSGHPSTLWWPAAGGVAAMLLVAFIVARKPRTTPRE